MTEFTSDIKTIPYTCRNVYATLADLRNLEKVKEKIPQEQISDFTCDEDSCTFFVNPVGNVRFVVVERQSGELIKFQAEQVPFAVNMWIQLKETSEQETKMKLTVKADLNLFLKPMVSKPLQEAVDKIAEMLASVPYTESEI